MNGTIPDFTWRAQMGFTRAELLRALPRAVTPYEIRNTDVNPVEIVFDNHIVHLHTGPERLRVIASLKIPELPVTLDFFGFDEIEFESFLSRFRRYLQKGGG